MDPGTLRKFAEDYSAAWCSQNPSRVAGFYAPNGTLTVNFGTPSRGRLEIIALAESFMAAFPDLRVVCNGVGEEGGRMKFCWTLTGTNTGHGGTGNRVHISGYELWRFSDDGLILESEGHFDSDDYNCQLQGAD